MYEKVGWKIVLIIIIVGMGFFFMFPPFSGIVPGWMEKSLFGVWPQEKGKLVLGEDLKGGLTLVLSVADAKQRDEVIEVLNKRVNSSGLKEVYITALGGKQIQVRAPAESPGLREMLMNTGTLEFHAEALPEEYKIYDDRIAAAANTDGGRPRPQSGFMVVNIPGRAGRPYLLLNSKVEFTARDFTNFRGTSDGNKPVVQFTLSSTAGSRFAELTEHLSDENLWGGNHGKLAVFINGDFESAPVVKSVISHVGIITLGGDDVDMLYKKRKALLTALHSGALQTPIAFESEIKTGPAIGEDSLRRGILSLVLGAIIVLLFMLVYYLAAGLIANVALVLNLILVMGALCGFQATFTLPGFAGLILTIGMAVDANILIFERIREEKAAGKALTGAVKAGYDRAFATILDSNITTLVIGIVLWWQGTGPIRGFAITLSVGIFASLFTSLFVGKVIFTICVKAKIFREVKMQRWIKRPNIPFMKISRVPLTLSLLLLISGIGLLGYRGYSLLGIDFLGGAQYQINLTKAITIEQARKDLASILPKGVVPEVQSVEPRLGTAAVAPGGGSCEFMIRLSQQLLNNIAAQEGISPEADPSEVVTRVEQMIRSKFSDNFPPKGLDFSQGETTFSRITFILVPREDTNLDRLKTSLIDALNEEGYPEDKYLPLGEPEGEGILEVTLNIRYPGTELQTRLDAIKKNLDEALLGADKYEFTNTTDHYTDPSPTVVVYAIFEVPPGFTDRQTDELLKIVPGLITRTIKENTARETDEGIQYAGYTVKEVKRVNFPQDSSPPDPGEGADTENPAEEKGVEILETEGGKKYMRFRIEAECSQTFDKAAQMLTTALSESLPDEEVTLPDGTKTGLVTAPGGIGQAMAITGSVAKDLRWKGFKAFIFAIIGIILYVWFRFRQFRFGFAAVVALMHDVIITLGILALLDTLPFFSLKFELPIVAALLTIVGYSINDSIVVFDRIRENMGLHREERFFVENIDSSINQTLTRTIWTSMTTFVVVLCLALLGGEMIRGFAMTMCVGILVGTYSSIFIASPVLVWFHKRELRTAPVHKFSRK